MRKYEDMNEKKIDLEKYPQEKMTEEEKERAFQRFCDRLDNGADKGKMFWTLRRAALYAAVMGVVLIVGGIGISYATGMKPVKTMIDDFHQRDEKVILQMSEKADTEKETEHRVVLDEYYLDGLGNGYMTFSIMRREGSREEQWNKRLEAYYVQDGVAKKFEEYSVEPIISEDLKYMLGIQLTFQSDNFIKYSDSVKIQFADDGYTFKNIKVTQSHYYEWHTSKGSVRLGSVGMLAESGTKADKEIGRLIDVEKATDGVVTVRYKDGSKKRLQIKTFYGSQSRESDAVIQFSPYTKLEKHLKEGKDWEDVKKEWKDNFSVYMFQLDKISSLTIGKVVLNIKDAEYH